MTRKTLVALSAALAFSTLVAHWAPAQESIPVETTILAEANGRESALVLAVSQRPTDQITYVIWYKGSRMNHWEVYTMTTNIRVARNIADMLDARGFQTWIENRYN